MKKEVISFRASILENDTYTFKERLKDNGFIEEVKIRFYPGVEKSLRVNPYILHKENRREELVTFPDMTDQFITGDDDYLTFPVSIEFAYDDEMAVDVSNVSDMYAYSLVVDVIVSYSGV